MDNSKGCDIIKEHYEHWLPKFLKVNGITFGDCVFYAKKKSKISDKLRKHEAEHVKQYKNDGFFIFLLRYFYEYLCNRLRGQNHYKAYFNISYEIEARKAEKN